MSTKNYLIVGATGKQGGGVIESLLKNPSTPFHIFALTRNAESARAKSLATIPNVSVIVGDPAAPESIFSELPKSLDGVFCMTVPGGKISEEDQAKPLIDACIKHRVKHFVFTSGDRGGAEISHTNPTPVPNLQSKHYIELYLKEQAEGRMTWTILRPTTFMEMLTGDIHGKGFGRLWADMGRKPLQLVSTKDIGHFGALALLEQDEYKGKAIGIAGDELTFDEASKIFKETTNNEMPLAPCIVGKGLKWAVGDLGPMFKWLETDGFKVDIQGARKQYPELQTFQQWLRDNSEWRSVKG
jgi:uncharacterized protein YbjT (DUF2867 family)